MTSKWWGGGAESIPQHLFVKEASNLLHSKSDPRGSNSCQDENQSNLIYMQHYNLTMVISFALNASKIDQSRIQFSPAL